MSPERTCVGCRERAPQKLLMRVAATSHILLVGRNVPGRGAWLHPTLRCLNLAERRSAFGRALRLAAPLDTAEIRSHLEGPAAEVSAL
ncbi:MAG: YlxR family protein [Actinomycetota bacterium]|nr:YlxR family protein [Actinomycetota bacterium]